MRLNLGSNETQAGFKTIFLFHPADPQRITYLERSTGTSGGGAKGSLSGVYTSNLLNDLDFYLGQKFLTLHQHKARHPYRTANLI